MKTEEMRHSRSLPSINPTRVEYNRIIGLSLNEEKVKQSLEKQKSKDRTTNSLDLIEKLLEAVKTELDG